MALPVSQIDELINELSIDDGASTSNDVGIVATKNKTETTVEELATEDRANYYSGITSITVNGKRAYELKGKFLDDLRDNAFSATNREDAVDNKEGVIDKGFYDIEEANNDDEQEIVEVDPELFTHDIQRTKTYEDYENKLNNELMNHGPRMECHMRCVIIFANLSVSKMGKLNGPLTIQMKMDSATEESYWEWFESNGKASNNFDVNDKEEEHKETCNLFNDTARDAPVFKIR
ncbi:hypothetical protein Tco_0223348 [Tanacetum coccineum]